MRNHRSLSILFFSVIVVALIFFTISFAAQKTATAQVVDSADQAGSSAEPEPVLHGEDAPTAAEAWASSAEPMTGTAVNFLSPPDTPAPTAPDEGNAPDALISWRIIGSALRPRENDVSYTITGSGGCSYVTTGDAFTVWNAPVNLPQGSVINTVRMYYSDTSASNSSAWFTIYDLYGNIVDEWSVTSTGDLGNGFNDSALIEHTIDYSTYSYLINWRPVVSGSSMALCGFRIFYEPPPFGLNFLPAVIN